MKQAQQWSKEDMLNIAKSFENCARIVESLGRGRKNKKQKRKQEKRPYGTIKTD